MNALYGLRFSAFMFPFFLERCSGAIELLALKPKTFHIVQHMFRSLPKLVETGVLSHRFSRQGRRKESYDYANTMQMLGLDEGDDSSNQDPTVIQVSLLL